MEYGIFLHPELLNSQIDGLYLRSSVFEKEFRQCDTNRCDAGRSAGHFYESAREFLTATGFSYLRPAGRRRRGTILDTSAGAGTCNFTLPFSLFLTDGGRATCVRIRGRGRSRKKERREGRFFWFSTSATSWSLL